MSKAYTSIVRILLHIRLVHERNI